MTKMEDKTKSLVVLKSSSDVPTDLKMKSEGSKCVVSFLFLDNKVKV